MRSYASAYKICGEVSPAESQRDGPIALCALPDYRNQRYRTRSGSASGDGVSSYVPGQGGEHHINEQPLEYWREKFREHGYVAIDYVRPKVIANLQVQHWYRYNILLYAEESRLATLPDPLRGFRVPDDQRLCNYWPLPDRIQHAVIRQLPRGAVDYLSCLKGRLSARRAQSAVSLS